MINRFVLKDKEGNIYKLNDCVFIVLNDNTARAGAICSINDNGDFTMNVESNKIIYNVNNVNYITKSTYMMM
jgi:hypothetical protein